MIWLGLCAAALVSAAMIWSICCPHRRLWPDKGPAAMLGWGAILVLFACVVWISLRDWNTMDVPATLRWPFGGGLLVLGHIIIVSGVGTLGMRQTSGDQGSLKTKGLYAHSRNPQYCSDMMILLGWGMLSMAPGALLLAAAGCGALILTAYAEEPWLAERYGSEYATYAAQTPRFF